MNLCCAAIVLGNVTEETLEQYYLRQQDSSQDIRPQTSGEVTHARKEVTPGKWWLAQFALPARDITTAL